MKNTNNYNDLEIKTKHTTQKTRIEKKNPFKQI